MSDGLKFVGKVKLYKNKKLVAFDSNVVVTTGLELLASIFGASGTKPTHMALGDNISPTTLTMTALQGTEFDRQAFDSTTVTGVNVQYQATFGPAIVGAKTISEVGIFNAASAGTMLARFITQPVLITNTDTVVIQWTITVGG